MSNAGSSPSRRVRLLISGRVQGVCFRQSAQEVAEDLALRGWVRNLPSGEVESVAEGTPENVAAFVDWCREGPPAACVGRVDISESSDVSPLAAFHVEHFR